jgi:FkbM family methyltransferase
LLEAPVLSLSSGTLLGKIVRYPMRILPRGMTVPVLQGPLRGMKWIVGSQRHACWLGSYESYVQNLIAREVKPGAVFYDLGANVGFYSLLASVLVGNGKVFAFEPLPANVRYLRKHLDLNRIKNVEVFEMAMSDQAGQASFQEEETRAMGRLDAGGTIQVVTATLDSLLQEQVIDPPGFIKMDIEGAEFQALLGARACLAKYKPKILLATHGKQVHRECCELLRSWRFDLQLVGEPSEDRAELLASPHA